MKKVFSLLLAVFAGFAFHSCEDVPAPYEINDEEGETGPTNVFFDETFTTSLGEFSAINTVGTYSWACSYSCAQVTSYADADGDGVKENNEAESWLISPAADLTDVEAACISFEYILRYANANQMESHYRLLISSDYVPGKLAEATWTALPFNLVQGSDWETWYSSGNINVPEEFLGQPNVTVALCYKATTKAATWEVKNFKMVRGAGDYNPETGEPTDEVRTLPYTESFATSLGGFKNYTTSGAGEWIIDYSTAKATGYDNATKVTTAGTYYLVSPAISLEGVTEAHVSYEYILRYNKGNENQQVLINANFNEEQPTEGWVLLKQDHIEGADWSTFSSADLNIPSEYLGKNIRLAFRYNTNATSGSTWEVKNFSIAVGKAEGSTGGNTNTGDVKTLPYTEAFTSELGAFGNYTTDGSGAWTIDYSTAKASGYDNATKVTTAGTYYLVSPEISLEGHNEAHVSYEYILRYDKGQENQQVLINTNFNAANPTEGWVLLNQTHTEGSDWSTFSKADIAIPAEYMGKNIRLAFRYNTNATSGSTWEVKNFAIQAGKPGENTDNGETGGESDPNSITYALASAGLENATDLPTLTLSDGTTLTFAQEGGNNMPKYYTAGKSARMYALNSLTITSADRKISKIVFNCDVPYNGKIYNGNEQMTATPGTISKDSDTKVTVSDINSTSTKIVNDWTSNSGGTQFRIVSLTITYAE